MVFPIASFIFAGIQFICRFIFVCGYRKGPNWRLIGGVPINLSMFAMLAMGVIACSKWIADVPKN